MNVTRTDRRVVTFYSFKGGVGRTMALANVAFRLADRNDLDVIVVDWDLEAPGLHRFFGISDEVAASTNGLLEYLLAWREAVEDDAEAPPDATGSLIQVTEPRPAHGSLRVLLAGRHDEGYSDRLRGFDWLPFYRFNAGYAAIETLRRQLAGQADMVLIDSRTGVTDAGGICTVQMPDGVVLMTAANEQSFKGIERVGRAIAKGERDRPGRAQPKVWVVVGRAPYLDVPKHGEDWFEEYGPRFAAGYREGLWAKVDHPRGLRSHRLPHVGRWGFGEQILPAQVEDDDPLAFAYGALGDALIQWAQGKEGGGPRQTVAELRRDVDVAEKRGDLARLSSALLELGYALSDAGELANAAEMFQKVAGIQLGRNHSQGYAVALVLLGEVRWDEKRLDEAEDFFKRAIEADPKYAYALRMYARFLSGVRKDHDRAEELYKRAIEAAPEDVHCLWRYANFLGAVRKDYDKAEELLRRAIEEDPKDANNLGDYADFLSSVRKDYDKAGEFFKRAFEADPKHAHNLANYAYFLSGVRKDYDRAEELYRRSIEADPKHVHSFWDYAYFLWDVRKDPDKAEELCKRAIEVDPKRANSLGRYAAFLSDVRKDPSKAEEFYKRAVEADPKHVNNLGNYANFLNDVRKDPDKAEEFYKRAIEADPKHAVVLGNYAFFLSSVRKRFDKAEELYKCTVEADPKFTNNLENYAFFLWRARKDVDGADEFFRRAIEVDSKHPRTLGNYAFFLWQARKDVDGAEEFFRRAIEADSKHVNNFWNYANFLRNVRKDLDKAEELYRRAIEANPKHAIYLGNYADFLRNVRNDPDKAGEFYERAIEADPKHANNLGNYAGMLLALGRQTDGLAMLDRALDAPAPAPDLRVECWFYAIAHRPPEQRGEALAQLKRLIVAEGARSPGWDLSANVERARSDGHPDAAWLTLLADVISKSADPAVLDGWPAWASA